MSHKTEGSKGHTETPWQLSSVMNIWAEDKLIAELPAYGTGGRDAVPIDERDANAAYIVLAVNHHRELVEALQEAKLRLEMTNDKLAANHMDKGPTYLLNRQAIEQAESVLSKVKGGE